MFVAKTMCEEISKLSGGAVVGCKRNIFNLPFLKQRIVDLIHLVGIE